LLKPPQFAAYPVKTASRTLLLRSAYWAGAVRIRRSPEDNFPAAHQNHTPQERFSVNIHAYTVGLIQREGSALSGRLDDSTQ